MSDTFNQRLQKISLAKKSKLCIGLDIDPVKMPDHMNKTISGMESHLKAIIDATTDICLAYKLNMAFYEQYGFKGYELMEKIVAYIDKRNIFGTSSFFSTLLPSSSILGSTKNPAWKLYV